MNVAVIGCHFGSSARPKKDTTQLNRVRKLGLVFQNHFNVKAIFEVKARNKI